MSRAESDLSNHSAGYLHIVSSRAGVDEMTYDFGTITSVDDNFSKSVFTTPIVTLPTDCTFAIENSAAQRYTFSFIRKSPEYPNDGSSNSEDWSNNMWKFRTSTLANRWQARQGGYIMEYVPEPDSTWSREPVDNDFLPSVHIPAIKENVYISKLSFNLPTAQPEILTGSITVIVGQSNFSRGDYDVHMLDGTALYPEGGKRAGEQDYKINLNEDAYITIQLPVSDLGFLVPRSDVIFSEFEIQDVSITRIKKRLETPTTAAVKDWEVGIYGRAIVDKYTLTGGPSEPFERLQITLSTKQLALITPAATNHLLRYVLPGKEIKVNLVGKSNKMVINSCSFTSGGKIKITAYDSAQTVLTDRKMDEIATGESSPNVAKLITEILEKTGYKTETGNLITNVNLDPTSPENTNKTCKFKNSTTMWDALQICAAVKHAKIFFANDRAYLIDYTRLNEYKEVFATPEYAEVFEIYPTMNNSRSPFYGNVLGSAQFDTDDGNTVINDVYYDDSSVYSDTQSIRTYTQRRVDIDLSQYIDTSSGNPSSSFITELAKYFVLYRSEPQEMVSVTMKERVLDTYTDTVQTGQTVCWVPMFPNVCAVSALYSSVDEMGVSSRSTLAPNKIKPQRTMLSKFVRNYPEFSTEYTFGEVKQLDLANNITRNKV